MSVFGGFVNWLSAWRSGNAAADWERKMAAYKAQVDAEEQAFRQRKEAQEYARLANKYSNSPGTFTCTANGLVEYRDPKGRLQTRRALNDLDRRRLWNWSQREARGWLSDGETRA